MLDTLRDLHVGVFRLWGLALKAGRRMDMVPWRRARKAEVGGVSGVGLDFERITGLFI